MRQQPSITEILSILSTIANELNNAGIDYLVYGSVAYFLYTNDRSTPVNDIDIIVRERDFNEINEIFETETLPFKVFAYPNNIHANHLELKGTDMKPFDVSFDS